MTRRRKIALAVLLTGLALAIVTGLVVVHPALKILTAYKAKMLCSEVFVAGRTPEAVLADLESHDLEPLRLIATRIEFGAKAVTARAPLGIIERRSSFRQHGGCAIVFEGHWAAAGEARPAATAPRETAARFDGVELAPDPRPNARVNAILDDAFADADPERPRRTRAVVVVANGRLVAERYATDFASETPMLGWSMTKGVLNALVGILVAQGRLSLDARAPFAEWQGSTDPRGGITLDHLLRMSSGLRFDEGMTTPVTDVTTMLFEVPDMGAFAAGKPLDAPPGTRWQYSSGTSLIISRWIRQVLGDDFASFPRRELFDRIGMSHAVLEMDASGTFAGSSFMYATARDWARFGLLYLQDGMWKGVRILPEGWVTYTRTPAPGDPSRSYGAHFWLRLPAKNGEPAAVLPADTFHAAGHEGQFVTIVPSRQTVIVRLGKTRDPRSWDHARFVAKVLDALK